MRSSNEIPLIQFQPHTKEDNTRLICKIVRCSLYILTIFQSEYPFFPSRFEQATSRIQISLLIAWTDLLTALSLQWWLWRSFLSRELGAVWCIRILCRLTLTKQQGGIPETFSSPRETCAICRFSLNPPFRTKSRCYFHTGEVFHPHKTKH